MTTVGVRELKSRISEYLRRVKAGESIRVTERGRAVATLSPLGGPPARPKWLEELIREGLVIPGDGRKITPPDKPIKTGKGKPLSEIVIEDRG